jgi:hypothetical protein
MRKSPNYAAAFGVLTAMVLAFSVSAAADSARPFGATLEGYANPVPTSDPCVLTNTEGGTGKAVHMGAIAWASSETVNFCTDPEGAEVQGSFVMTAANGDQLHGEYTTLAHPDFTSGVITFSGQWTIVGGTGRFENATGGGTLTGEGSLAPPFAVMASFVGKVSY